jgi:hypothetical protein
MMSLKEYKGFPLHKVTQMGIEAERESSLLELFLLIEVFFVFNQLC